MVVCDKCGKRIKKNLCVACTNTNSTNVTNIREVEKALGLLTDYCRSTPNFDERVSLALNKLNFAIFFPHAPQTEKSSSQASGQAAR